jgi:hypothetical protein
MSDTMPDLKPLKIENATFYTFKGYSLSRKYYTSGRGNLSKMVFDPSTPSRIAQIFSDNDGCWPGLNGPGETFFRVVIGDETTDHGYPLMFDPTKDAIFNSGSSA